MLSCLKLETKTAVIIHHAVFIHSLVMYYKAQGTTVSCHNACNLSQNACSCCSLPPSSFCVAALVVWKKKPPLRGRLHLQPPCALHFQEMQARLLLLHHHIAQTRHYLCLLGVKPSHPVRARSQWRCGCRRLRQQDNV